MPIENTRKLTVAAAFAAAMISATPLIASAGDQATPSPAAVQQLEKVAHLFWFPWPFPPKFEELIWPEFIHAESTYPA